MRWVVNADSLLLEQIITSRLFHSIQLHGDETPDDVSFLMERGLRVIKALQVKDESSLDCIALYACTDILLDAYNPALYGGSGESFPWHLAELARLRHPDKRIILSGGLNPDNVAEAVSQVRPAAVDVASGVESEPGIKDPAKMAAFVRNARSVLVA